MLPDKTISCHITFVKVRRIKLEYRNLILLTYIAMCSFDIQTVSPFVNNHDKAFHLSKADALGNTAVICQRKEFEQFNIFILKRRNKISFRWLFPSFIIKNTLIPEYLLTNMFALAATVL